MVSYDNTYGALLIGVLTAGIMYGVTCVQTWFYFARYPSDPWHYKLLVAVTFLLDTSHQAVITHTIYTYVITYFGLDNGGVLVWSVIGEVFLNALTTLLVQCFLVVRIWKLSNKNWFMTGSALLLVLAELFVAFIFSSKTITLTTFAQLIKFKPLSLTINALAAAGDALIAGMLCYLLQKSRTGFRKSETMINKLILFTINTGLLTSVCALSSFICYNAWPHTYIYIAFYFNIGRLYCNSLLATLNAREGLRGESQNEEISLSHQCRSSSRTKQGFTSSKHAANNISIKVDTMHEFMHDRDELSSPHIDIKDGDVV